MTSTSVWPTCSFNGAKLDDGALLSSGLSNKVAFFDLGWNELDSSDNWRSEFSASEDNFSCIESVKTSSSLVDGTEFIWFLNKALLNAFAWMPTSLRTPYRSNMLMVRQTWCIKQEQKIFTNAIFQLKLNLMLLGLLKMSQGACHILQNSVFSKDSHRCNIFFGESE